MVVLNNTQDVGSSLTFKPTSYYFLVKSQKFKVILYLYLTEADAFIFLTNKILVT